MIQLSNIKATQHNRVNGLVSLPDEVRFSPMKVYLRMQFLFVSSDLCSPAFFSSRIAPYNLAVCCALLEFALQDLHPLDNQIYIHVRIFSFYADLIRQRRRASKPTTRQAVNWYYLEEQTTNQKVYE